MLAMDMRAVSNTGKFYSAGKPALHC